MFCWLLASLTALIIICGAVGGVAVQCLLLDWLDHRHPKLYIIYIITIFLVLTLALTHDLYKPC